MNLLKSHPFFSHRGQLNILLAPVGCKYQSTYPFVEASLSSLCATLELDSETVSSDIFSFRGIIPLSLHASDTPESLAFLVGLADPLMPHLSYHIICGAAKADTMKEVRNCNALFNKAVEEAKQRAAYCLFVFTSEAFEERDMPPDVIQIRAASSEQEKLRRIREGLISCIRSFINKLEISCIKLQSDPKELPANQLQLGCYAYALGGVDEAKANFLAALKHKPGNSVVCRLFELMNSDGIKFDVDKSYYEKEYALLKDEGGRVPAELISALALGSKSSDKQAFVRLLARVAFQYHSVSRPLLMLCLQLMKDKAKSLGINYHYLVLILLKYTGNVRTFMFYCNLLIEKEAEIPYFILKEYVESIINDSDWIEQRIVPASKLFTSNISRPIKNQLISYLLSYLHVISNKEKQRNILSLIPSNMDVRASQLFDVKDFSLNRPKSPIQDVKKGRKSAVFIYTPLENKSNDFTNFSKGDILSFNISIYNPLLMALKIDMISLNGLNIISYPTSIELPSRKKTVFSLMAKAKEIGEIILNGFSIVSDNFKAVYDLPSSMKFSVVEEIPQMIIKQPIQIKKELFENTEIKFDFEMINQSNLPINIKSLKFGPMPAVLNSTSLPIVYPPPLMSALPESINGKSSHKLSMMFNPDQTNTVLSFAIEYGSDKYIRRFEFNQQFEIKEGPHIKSIQPIPLDDYDDFDNTSLNLIVVISNPLDETITVKSKLTDETIFINAKSLGTLILKIDRFVINFDQEATTFNYEGITKEHIRKCEANAVREKNDKLTIEEIHDLWSSLILKKNLQNKILLSWDSGNGLTGYLPFTNLVLDQATKLALQPPPFTVSYKLSSLMENIWELTCKVDCKQNVDLVASLSYNLEDIGDNPNIVFTAGSQLNKITAPTEFKQAIHCLPIGKLKVVGHFTVRETVFIRIGTFDLSKLD